MSRVTIEELETAREWLLINEGDQGEMEACQKVAKWIATEIEQRELRAAAHQAGCTVAMVRKVIAKQNCNSEAK